MNAPGRSPWDKRPNPPGVEEVLNALQQRFLRHLRWRHLWPALLIVLVAWLLTGIFVINPQEQGAVQTFGKLTRIVGPGPNFHWPYPIEKLTKERVTEVRRLEIGFRVVDPRPPARVRPVPNESLMLTGDESIVDIQFTALAAEYRKARRVTRDRLRIETMEQVLPKLRKVVVDDELGGNVVPLLSLGGEPWPGGRKP